MLLVKFPKFSMPFTCGTRRRSPSLGLQFRDRRLRVACGARKAANMRTVALQV